MPYFLPPAQMRHRADLQRQLEAVDREAGRCCIPGCRRPCQQQAGKGLSATHCRYHVQWRNRHGCPWKASYSKASLRPYRRAADRFIREHREEFWTAHAILALKNLMANAGAVERVQDTIHFAKPAEKARNALARLRHAGIPPERLLAIHLAISAALLEDPVSPGGGGPDEYRLVQIAKAAQRCAAGPPTALGKYPRSGGLALRHLGRLIDGCCEHAAEKHLDAVLALKVSLYGPASPDHFAHVNAPTARWFQ
jgi:hypothetical protein